MTIGTYPDGVPAAFRIAPSRFVSAPLPRFTNVASEVGLGLHGLSGGSVIEDLDGDGLLDVVASAIGFGDQIRLFRNTGAGALRGADRGQRPRRHHRRPEPGAHRLRQRRPARHPGAARRLDGRGRAVPGLAAAQSRRLAILGRDEGGRPGRRRGADADRGVVRLRRRRLARPVRRPRSHDPAQRALRQPPVPQQSRRHVHRRDHGGRHRRRRLRQGGRARRLRQRRPARPLPVAGPRPQPAAAQRRPAGRAAAGASATPPPRPAWPRRTTASRRCGSTTTTTAGSTSTSAATSDSRRTSPPISSASITRPIAAGCITTTATAPSPTSRAPPASGTRRS